jgi:hypothetical protein
MKLLKLTKIFVMFLSLGLVLQGCTEDDAASTDFNYATFETLSKDVAVNPGETLSSDIKVYVTQVSGSDRSFNLVIDPTSTIDMNNVSVPTTVTIPANSNFGTLTIDFEGVDLDLSLAKTLKLKLVEENGLYTGKTTQINVRENCPLNTVTLALILDRYGSETDWEIVDDNTGDVVASGGPYTDTATNALQPVKNFILCLPDGSYTFTIYDAYGDGMVTSASVIGSYVLTANGVVIANQSGNFSDSRSHSFTL